MSKKKTLFGVLLIIAALIIMTLPVSEADAASSASDFVMEGSTLVKYQGTDRDVSVPNAVEIIGKSAFEENTNIERVTLPNTVKSIEAYAFWGCDNLDTVILGRGLTEVGDYAFAGCGGLKQMAIPANVVSIGIQAFGDCVNMTDISIPAETLYIHKTAFDGCAKLTIHCEAGTAADTFAESFYEKQKEMAEYEDISDYQPSDSEQESKPDEPEATPMPDDEPEPTPTPEEVNLPESILGSTSIVGNRAFVFLETDEMKVIETTPEPDENDISREESLENIVAIGEAESIPKYTLVDGKIVADQAYYRNSQLGEITLPEGIEEIGQFSFARSSVTGITLPEGVTKIGYGAFYHCDSLEEVELPESVMSVEPRAFDYTAWVENFKSSGEDFLISGGVLIAYAGHDNTVAVPGGVRVIAAEAFSGHEEIISVRLPDSVCVIGEAAFEDCTGLKRINLGEGVEQIKDRAFSGCNALEVINLPESVKLTGLQAFGNTEVIYNGSMPEESYEDTATRLSNEKFRNPKREEVSPGVTILGISPSTARLEGASAQYTLFIEQQEDKSVLETAWSRALGSSIPENMTVYDLRMTDSSDIPIIKLGHSGLTVVIPVPENLAGQELKMVTLDRNGQLEAIAVERVSLEGKEAFCFRTTFLSSFGVYGTGSAQPEVLREINMNFGSMSSAPEKKNNTFFIAKAIISTAFVFTGITIIWFDKRRKKLSHH